MHEMHQRRSMLHTNSTNAQGARQLHELYDNSYSQSGSVFTINARNAQNAPHSLELKAITGNEPGARQLHELIWTVTVNLTWFSRKMHQMHQSRCMLRATTKNAPGARQLHELYDDSYSQSCSVFTKNARNAPNAPK